MVFGDSVYVRALNMLNIGRKMVVISDCCESLRFRAAQSKAFENLCTVCRSRSKREGVDAECGRESGCFTQYFESGLSNLK